MTEYSSLINKLAGLESNLQSLVTTADKLELDLSQGTLPWKILKAPMINPNPIKPEITKNIIYIILLTLLFASIITFIIEKLDDVFHNVIEVEKFIDLPILGFVPFFNIKNNQDSNESNKIITINDFSKEENQIILNEIKFIFEETFRNIYTSIKFSNSDEEIKIINITSTIPEEGKSLCSLFLAMNINDRTTPIEIMKNKIK